MSLPVPRQRTLHAPVTLAVSAAVLLAAQGCEDGPVESSEPPTVSIDAPSEGQEFVQGDPVPFQGTAHDPEDGPLTGASLGWFSSIDRQLGNGTSLVRDDLSTGPHEIRLTAVDSDQNVRNTYVNITVLPPNEPPTATIASPTDGQTFREAETVEFSGSATDLEDGALAGSALAWTSSVDGPLGTGASFQRADLSTGDHQITLTATDSRDGTGVDQVSITVEPNESPTATIVSPADGGHFSPGQPVPFQGSGDDAEDGALTGGSLTWTSSLDGPLGSGEQLERDDLSEGDHTITLTATDGLGATGSAEVSITVANLPPATTIQSPSGGSVFVVGEAVEFAGSAEDPEDGTLSGGSLVWTSSLDDVIGTGGSFQRSDLSEGVHTVTLVATDTEGGTGSAEVVLEVSSEPQNPEVSITSPGNGASFLPGQTVDFAGSAEDPQDGTLGGGALSWTSSLDGAVGTGTAFSRDDLSEGAHTITLTATDSDGRTGSAQVGITVAPPNTAPEASITSPDHDDLFQLGETITFQGSGNDAQDGSLSGAALSWSSSIDGFLGTGTSFQSSGLSAGSHEITLTATDSDGASDTESVDIVVNAPPSATFLSPANGATFDFTESITFNGSGSDPEDGARTPSWSSSIDGFLGTGVFSRDDLSSGVHVITMTVTDTDGGSDSVQRTITVRVPLSYESDIWPMFTSPGYRVAGGECTDCHFSGSGLAVVFDTDASTSYSQLLSGRVTPGDDTEGALLCQITDGDIDGDSCDATAGDMEMISSAISKIRLWIRQGAGN